MLLMMMMVIPHLLRQGQPGQQSQGQKPQPAPAPGPVPAAGSPMPKSPMAQGGQGAMSGPKGGFAGGQNMLGVLPHQDPNYYTGRTMGMR
jgi:hypothetical protein